MGVNKNNRRNTKMKELKELIGLNNSINKFFLKIRFIDIRGLLLDLTTMFEMLIVMTLMIMYLILSIVLENEYLVILIIFPILIIITHLINCYIRKEVKNVCDLYEDTIDMICNETEEEKNEGKHF